MHSHSVRVTFICIQIAWCTCFCSCCILLRIASALILTNFGIFVGFESGPAGVAVCVDWDSGSVAVVTVVLYPAFNRTAIILKAPYLLSQVNAMLPEKPLVADGHGLAPGKAGQGPPNLSGHKFRVYSEQCWGTAVSF